MLKNVGINISRTVFRNGSWGSIMNELMDELLIGGWTNPFEKYARQNGNLPQWSGWKNKCLSCHHLDYFRKLRGPNYRDDHWERDPSWEARKYVTDPDISWITHAKRKVSFAGESIRISKQNRNNQILYSWPLRELTAYPTWGQGKSSSKVPW